MCKNRTFCFISAVVGRLSAWGKYNYAFDEFQPIRNVGNMAPSCLASKLARKARLQSPVYSCCMLGL